jgi:hypothetical protein
LFEIVEFSSYHVFIKLRHAVLSFAFAVHLLAAPLIGLLVEIIYGSLDGLSVVITYQSIVARSYHRS